ncbi:Cysteine-rich receptor-like protein kinase 15 [Triticum urartu]|uniref:Cysteine-rich receptor-like protein kinase 15 n=1 Tax=Triticum urartu TaxID=4572 RepID=M7ZSN9_TRIUA|nr:Cysteine-rich receptor-like protein kinase 15 [Triticum urartu]
MEHHDITPQSDLEGILFDESAEPKALPLSLLEHITSGFSRGEEIGNGGFATVYKGMLDNGMVAVKKLFGTVDLDEKKFSEEIRCLMKAKHKNIVRFLGYCADTQGEMVDCGGKLVLADVRQRLLCFEYLPKGSLDKHITDASCGLEWRERYQIINGICDGLYYLHQKHIVHLDLKPGNILLDNNMIPKISDFGLLRCFDENQTRTIASKVIGTMGYLAPEFCSVRQITVKSDIYSLGTIIIEIITGEKGYADVANVIERWSNRLEKSQPDTQLEQVRVCTEIAIECSDFNPARRPDTNNIINRLRATKNADEFATELKVRFPGDYILIFPCTQIADMLPDRETSSDVEQTLIIGWTEEKQKILSILSESITEEMVILPIYGIGGIGKTTLAQLVFNDPQFQDYTRVWVYVSQELNLSQIGNSIITQLTDKIGNISTKQMLHKRLKELFFGKRILIVLDDLWEENPKEFDKLKVMLGLGLGRKVVIVTTRDGGLARKICSPAVTPYKLETLTVDKCWTIIKQKADFEDRVDQEQLEHIGREIATKCGGVALAAQSLGHMLNGMTADEWESLSEDYIMQLLGMFFLEYSKDPKSGEMQDRDVTFFRMNDLVHDLARMILAHQFNDKGSVGGNKCRYALLTDCSNPLQFSFTSPANIKALHFRDCSNTQLRGSAFSSAKCLRVLDLSECLIQKLPDCIGQLKQLRFLHAPRIQDKMIPNCITELSELNYLNLRGSEKILALPESIGDIKGLMHLDLSGCTGISELPISFAELKQLVHLDLSHCRVSISEAFGGFTKLQYLNLSVEHSDRRLPDVIGNLIKLSDDQIGRLLGSICTLSNLEHLDLSGNRKLSSIPTSIGNLRQLHTLDLSGCHRLKKLPNSMINMVNLKVLIVEKEVRLDESMCALLNFVSLPHFVVYASSDKCSSNINLLEPTNPDKLTIDRLENVKSTKEAWSIKLIEKQNMKVLTFRWTENAERFVDDKDVLEQLVPPSSVQILTIVGYTSLSIPDWLMDIRQYLPDLLELNLLNFPKCNTLPALGQLPNLLELDLYRMESLEEWNTAYNTGEGGANGLMFPKLEKLSIKQCRKLRIGPCLPRALS